MRLTIRQFQDIMKVSETDLPELDKSILIVRAITGKSEYEVNKMKGSKFTKIVNSVNKKLSEFADNVNNEKPKKFISVNGTTYRLHYDINRLSSGKYVEAVAFQDDMINNLHKLLATMAVPMRWTWRGIRAKPYKAEEHAKIAEQMLDADFSVAYHACLFFCAVSLISIKDLSSSGKVPGMKNLDQLENRLISFLDGSIMASWYRNLKISS
jgi:hypothetical protein